VILLVGQLCIGPHTVEGKKWLLLFCLLEQIQAWLQILLMMSLVDKLLVIWLLDKVIMA